MSRDRALGLPLLTKELIEHAARKRTYVIRSVYAVLLFGFSLLIFWGSVYSRNRNSLELLGKGREMFFILMGLQTAGIMLFTPALTCGSLTIEKERNTFCLLLLTRLGPWTILFEKYLSRLLLVLTFLLISLPLFGFCYALGGLEQLSIWSGFLSLFVTVLQLSAIGLFCSAFFRSTVQSFVAAYLISALVLFGPIIAGEMFDIDAVEYIGKQIWLGLRDLVRLTAETGMNAIDLIAYLTGQSPLEQHPSYTSIQITNDLAGGMLFNAPILTIDVIDNRWRTLPAWSIFIQSFPALCSGMLFFVMARLVVIRRAFATPKNYLVKSFRMLDGLLHRLNHNRFTKGIVLIDDTNNLPDMEPIAWRETTKTSLGNLRYLVRMFMLIELPILVISFFVLIGGSNYRGQNAALSILYFIGWILAVLFVSVRAATLVSKERSHETLDVLLSTPLTSHELVRQKFRGVSRLIVVLSIPLLTLILAHTWFRSIASGGLLQGLFQEFFSDPEDCPFINFVVQVTCVLIYLPMLAWVCFYIGLWMKTPTRAIFASLALVVAWCVISVIILVSLFDVFNVRPGSEAGLMLIISPAIVPFAAEIRELGDIGGNEFVTYFINSMMHVVILFYFRYLCHSRAAQMLGRSER